MPAGIYLHIPFCKSRCSYCDFATDVYRSGDAVERYVAALCREIENFEGDTPEADTIYFGGGTPSLLSPRQVENILDSVRRKFPLASEIELTMEMNPATVTPGSLAGYRSLGVNRASFGVQTFNDTDLRRLARGHTAEDALRTFEMLRGASFSNISLDLITGLPGQTVADWEENLARALALGPEHLSLYILEVHEGTPLAEQIRSGRQPEPDVALVGEMYALAGALCSADGLSQYELSNYALPGFESRHNTKYWTLEPVFGFGVSAHSFDGTRRYSNERDTNRYVQIIENAGVAEVHSEPSHRASEAAFLGLRLARGLDLEEYKSSYGIDLAEKYAGDLAPLFEAGLIIADGPRLRLTQRGMLYSNEVFSVFV